MGAPNPSSLSRSIPEHIFTDTLSSRRVCPGIHVAQRTLRLNIARLLWAFDFSEVHGQPIELNAYDGLSGRSPVPFMVCLKPRHGNVEKVLEAVEGCEG